jgi:hypothetical protein
MKYLKLFEDKQTESKIAEICMKYGIENWSINSEGLVDVNSDVDLYRKLLFVFELPLNFGHITGSFDCSTNYLTNLKGCPHTVGGYFDCYDNKLTSLEGCPKSVSGSFDCSHNQLTTLRFAPEEVEGEAFVLPNPISDIPKEYLNGEYLEFIVKEQYDWRLYQKDGTLRLDRLEEMIEWGIETKKIKPL